LLIGCGPSGRSHAAGLYAGRIVAGNETSVTESLCRVGLLRRVERRVELERQDIGGGRLAQILLPAMDAGVHKFGNNVGILCSKSAGCELHTIRVVTGGADEEGTHLGAG